MSLICCTCWFCSTLNKQKTIVEVKIQEEGYGTVHAFKEAAIQALCGQEAATGTRDLIAENSFYLNAPTQDGLLLHYLI